MNRSVKTPPETVPGRELGPTSAQVARRERLAASRTSSQRVRIISASAASPTPEPPAPPWATGAEGAAEAAPQPALPWAAGALGAAGALAGSAAREDCSAGREAAAAEGAEGPGEAEAPSFGPSQLTVGPACEAGAVDVGPAAGAEGAAGASPQPASD